MPIGHHARQFLLAAITAGLYLHGSTSIAHTTFKSQAYEGKTDDNALKIGHGCEVSPGVNIPVIAQSVVFPMVRPELSASDTSTVNSLGDVIVQGTLAGLFDSIQDRSIFLTQGEKQNAAGNATGFWSKNGKLGVHFRGRVPFQFTAPTFVAASCAKRLLVKAAVADICDVTAPTVAAGKVNLWIPDNGSQYANDGKAAGVDGVGAAPTLTVNRDLVTNPFANPAACGAGIDVTVTPAATEVDSRLQIPGYWSRQ